MNNSLFAFYTEELPKFKTVATKKRMLTKWKKEVQEHLTDLQEAFKRPDKYRFLHGEKVTLWKVKLCEAELKYIINLYKNL